MNFLYVNTKINLHPAKIEVYTGEGKRVSFRSSTIIIVEYDQLYKEQMENALSREMTQEVLQSMAGVIQETTYKKKKRYQRATL